MTDNRDSLQGLVLVADDDATQRVLSKRYLEFAGFEVCEADNGELAAEVFAQRKPGMVLMDVQMPKANGFEACRKIRASEDGEAVPIIMVTGLEDLESIERAYDAGATDFITKPVVWETLGHRARYLMRAGSAIRELRISESRLAQAQRVARLASWDWDFAKRRINCSPDVYKLFDVAPDSIGSSFAELMNFVHPEDKLNVQQVVEDALANNGVMLTEFRFVNDKNVETIVELQATFIEGSGDKPARMVGSIQDISERRRAQQKIHELAYYDSLTNLPNRELFRTRAERALRAARRDKTKLALLFVDLDQFKYVNDSMGHTAGDKLLCAVAEKLENSVRASDLVATSRAPDEQFRASISRLGGDEFTILLSNLSSEHTAALVAERVIRHLGEPTIIDGKRLAVTGSIGVSMYPDNADSIGDLLKTADIAMYHAKQQGRDGFRFFAPEMQASVQLRLSMESKLRAALESDELTLHYQAKVDTRTGCIAGVEALLRWNDPELGPISPARFIPVAEDTGLIIPIGEWVLREACRQSQVWAEAGLAPLKMAVNLSSLQFRREGLRELVRQVIKDTAVDPSRLELELTESVIMEDADTTIEILEQLKAMGIAISVDDFGTGYSSMAYLRRFPLDVVKIDRSFIEDISFDASDTVIVRAMIALAQGLNLTCIAEGVETQEQLDVLRSYGCDQVQGFFLNRPMPSDEMTAFLEQREREPFKFAPRPEL